MDADQCYKEVDKIMRINTNISALNAWRQLSTTNTAMSKSLEKLSSGFRINRAADDAAGLAISEKMRSQIRGLNQAMRNAQDGISMIQTAEGALTEVHSILQRMRELAVQASSGAMATEDVAAIDLEIGDLVDELDRIATTTQFNTQTLLDGNLSASILIGANSGETVDVVIGNMTATQLGFVPGTYSIAADPESAIDTIDAAIETVSTERATLGALQNRLEHTINNLGAAAENLQAAESRIRDVDMALEMASFTKHQILLQAGTAMLAQANMSPQSVLKLLG
jgi:flagellin